MCGLVGIAGNLEFRDENLMKNLLLFDFLRGPDSTGLASIRNHGPSKIYKVASDPLVAFDSSKFKETLNGPQSKVLIGHNRASTMGKTNNFNAHPFEFDHIIGAHNGTLDTQSFRRLQDKLEDDFEVDSMAIFASIAKFGLEETIALCEEGRDYAKGAWSLVWYNSADDTINFIRNKHRPMWYAHSKDYKKLFWASEWWMIRAAIDAAKSGYELAVDSKGHGYFQTEENTHYKFDVGLIKAGGDKKPKPKCKEVLGKEPALVTSVVHDPFRPTPVTGDYGRTGTTIGSTQTPANVNIPKQIYLIGNDTDPFAGVITPARYYEMGKHGCSWCEDPLDYFDPGQTIFEVDGVILCPGCSGTDMDKPPVARTSRVYLMESEMRAFR